MEQYLFTTNKGNKVMVDADSPIPQVDKFTIMSIRGIGQTIGVPDDFKRIFPYKLGDVVNQKDFDAWLDLFLGFFSGVKHYTIGSENEAEEIGADERVEVSISIDVTMGEEPPLPVGMIIERTKEITTDKRMTIRQISFPTEEQIDEETHSANVEMTLNGIAGYEYEVKLYPPYVAESEEAVLKIVASKDETNAIDVDVIDEALLIPDDTQTK